METLANFRTAAAVVGALLALVVAAIIVVRVIRARASRAPPMPMPLPLPPGTDSDAAYLDSSHIIAGPLSGAAERPAEGAGVAGSAGGDPAKPGGADAVPRR